MNFFYEKSISALTQHRSPELADNNTYKRQKNLAKA